MSRNNKQRKNRIQGNWAQSPTSSSSISGNKHQVLEPSQNNLEQRHVAPRWLDKIVDNPLPSSDKFFYEPQDIDFKEKQDVTTISKSGIYDLSTEPSGLSRIRFFTHFLEKDYADQLYKEFLHELPWKQMTGSHKGEKYLEPRLNAFFANVAYKYSGVTHPATPQWPESLVKLKSRLEDQTGLLLNGVLANLYRTERDSVAWHSDDEPVLGPNPTVVSISLGTTRNFYLRKKPADGSIDDISDCCHYKFPLPHGSLLIMEGSTQDDWQHCVPKEYHSRGPRINLTFRSFITS